MDFTREPVVETVITPREGCKLVVRSSKGASQEEYFVEAIEVVSFGDAFFYRSTEKPKCFLLPVVDYEILEVREARIVLKHSTRETSIKIGKKVTIKEEKKEQPKKEEQPKPERKRERKKHFRKRRGGAEGEEIKEQTESAPKALHEEDDENKPTASSIIRSLLSPPPLISETIGHYRETYSQAFFDKDEEEEESENYPVPVKETPIVVAEETSEESSTKDLWNFSD